MLKIMLKQITHPLTTSTDEDNPRCGTTTHGFTAFVYIVVSQTVSPPQNQMKRARPAGPNVQLYMLLKKVILRHNCVRYYNV